MSNTAKGTSQTPCRNILIHGYCKYADKGCMFRHDTASNATPNSQNQSPSSAPLPLSTNSKKKLLNADSPAFMPGKPITSSTSSVASSASPTSSPKVNNAKLHVDISQNGGDNGGERTNSSDPKKPQPKISAANIAAPAFVPRSVAAKSGTETVTGATSVSTTTSNATSKPQFSPERFIKAAAFRPGPVPGPSSGPLPEAFNPHNEFHGAPGAILSGGTPGSAIPGHNIPLSDQMPEMGMMPDEFTAMHLGQGGPVGHLNDGGSGQEPSPYMNSAATQGMIFQHHTSYTLNYHVYAPTPLGVSKQYLDPHQRLVEDFFISNDVREELQRKNEATLQVIPGLNLPEYVNVYHSLVLLDTSPVKSTKSFGYPSWTYKCVSNMDGRVYCMRRIEGFRLTNERAMKLLKLWGRVNSPGVVALHEAFTTREFGDSSLILIYDYYPLSVTIYDAYFSPHSAYQMRNAGMPPQIIPEELIWGYVSQLLMALKSIHERGLAARMIDPSKLIITKKGRIRVNCCGVMDFVEFKAEAQTPGNSSIDINMKEDITNIGRMVLSLACCSLEALANLNQSLAYVARTYSADLVDFIKTILIENTAGKQQVGGRGGGEGETDNAVNEDVTVRSLLQKFGYKLLDVLDSSLFENDKLEGELSTELENGRLVRLMTKLNFVMDRPEQEQNPSWSETGERYIISLFRDYVFHQVDEMGNPVIDLNHVLSCLNKLDAGIDESILLLSRDEQSFVIVTYKEMKACVDSAFRELRRR